MSDPFFSAFVKQWMDDTFMEGAFGGPADFDEYLYDYETGAGDSAFDNFSKEIADCILPADIELEVWKF